MATKELELESRIGGVGLTGSRDVPIIDLSDFDARRDEIADQLWDAAANVGFFQIKNHGIPAELIDLAFANSKRFFDLPTEIKKDFALGNNVGWEYMSQVRPSTGTQDQKQSYQITMPRMDGYFPSESQLPGFRKRMETFEQLNWQLSLKLLKLFAEKMHMKPETIEEAHNHDSPVYQSTLRLLHYFALKVEELDDSKWRAGAHTDFSVLTLLYQRDGQGGLEVCPGADSDQPIWAPVTPYNDVITCNIGDMLMRWSDDQLKSTLHRVRAPRYDGTPESLKERYTVVYFAQANEDALLRGPLGRYPPITAGEYIKQRLQANYNALKGKLK